MRRPTPIDEPVTDRPAVEARPGSVRRTDPAHPRSRRRPPDGAEGTGRAGPYVAATIGAIAALIAVIAVVQNSGDVAFEFLWWSATLPLAILLAIAALAGAFIADTAAALIRRRRRVRRAGS